MILYYFVYFFFNDAATTEIYTLSLHDALPISSRQEQRPACSEENARQRDCLHQQMLRALARRLRLDRKSTRLNSSHTVISYAVFCLKKKIEIAEAVRANADAEPQVHNTIC